VTLLRADKCIINISFLVDMHVYISKVYEHNSRIFDISIQIYKYNLPWSQLFPCQPGTHMHEYAFWRLIHVAPFLHGAGAHSLISEILFTLHLIIRKKVYITFNFKHWTKCLNIKSNNNCLNAVFILKMCNILTTFTNTP
jgi:hypothetical protein